VVFFEIRGELAEVETFAVGKAIRELPRLRKLYGKGRWRKRKGFADVKLPNGTSGASLVRSFRNRQERVQN
jgi:hypothetical protein